ncbi:hypothetical protein ACD591_01595 [Rufibacter glacialis]|uniref:Uncharacterized protein n=1 Tax=Rufibacter glacialis TaxID=1259555 RepID=A0A5M8QHM0_9BACT|nr:hypothetical protein [Rufibacter glacialis]KAA6435587.1 hypothetical protein FOE74_06495 [Rufibacter glacialis]GGK64801.1 hypothetical protein GCM10011405_10970 [Rufibacter glacialis]
MENTAPHYQLIEKEMIPRLQFGPDDVLQDKEQKVKRQHSLERASLLGNGYQGKVELTFQVASGEVLRMQTTIWQADKEFTTIKSGVTLPTHAILGVEFF